MPHPLDIIFWILALGWLAFIASRLHATRHIPTLPREGPGPGEPRRVSAIVTARNEEHRIEETVRRLLAQRGIDLEVIVVDDRSDDSTPRILDTLGDAIRRMRVDRLPEGWLGKTHACAEGARVAGGDWLLFADADVWMSDDLVARAVAAAERAGADHVCLLPREHRPSFLGRAVAVHLALVSASILARVNRGVRGAFVGVGAFNLVHADAYRQAGGHDGLRLAVVDDLALGLLLCRGGFRTRALEAFDDLEVNWAPNIPALFRTVEKNMFAVLGFSVPLTALLVGTGLAVCALSVAGPFTGRLAGLAAGLCWVLSGLPGLPIARRAGFGVWPVLVSPFMTPVFVAAVANSAIRTLAAGGIRWRGTFYPLEQLAPDGVWRFFPPVLREALGFPPRDVIPPEP